MTHAAKRRLRRVARPWRVVFVVYALALTVGTHWPELRIAPDAPASDKEIHLLTFAGFTVLLWCTRWLPATWVVGVIAAAFAALDELTQGLAILNRWVSGEDLAVNVLGVGVALTWIWAVGPVGGPANRMRLAYRTFGWEQALLRPAVWVVLALAGAAGAVVLGAAGLSIAWLLDIGRAATRVSVLAFAAGGGMIATYLVLQGAWRRWHAAHSDARPCFRCGGGCTAPTFDESGRGSCPSCHAPIHRGQWMAGARPRLTVIVSLTAAIASSIMIIGVSRLLVGDYFSNEALRRALPLSTNTYVAITLACVALLGGLMLRWFRFWHAPLHDRQHLVCRRCRHDLRGTPVEQGVGHCGECGAPFVKLESRND